MYLIDLLLRRLVGWLVSCTERNAAAANTIPPPNPISTCLWRSGRASTVCLANARVVAVESISWLAYIFALSCLNSTSHKNLEYTREICSVSVTDGLADLLTNCLGSKQQLSLIKSRCHCTRLDTEVNYKTIYPVLPAQSIETTTTDKGHQ